MSSKQFTPTVPDGHPPVLLSFEGHPLSLSLETRLHMVQVLRWWLRLDPRPDHSWDELNRGKGWFENDAGKPADPAELAKRGRA